MFVRLSFAWSAARPASIDTQTLVEVKLPFDPVCLSIDRSVIISSFTSHAPIGALVKHKAKKVRAVSHNRKSLLTEKHLNKNIEIFCLIGYRWCSYNATPPPPCSQP